MGGEQALFDYGRLTPTIATDIRAAAERIRVRMKRTAEDIIEIGRDLITVKEKLDHGQFLPWISKEFGMKEDMAQNFMRVARRFGDQIPNYSAFAPTVLIALASAPPEVVTTIEDRAAAGESITVADVKAEIARVRAEAEAARREAAEATYRLEVLKTETTEKLAKASRREANLIERANAAEKEKARAIAEAGLRAQETLKDRITQVEAEAAESRRLAGEKTRALDAAVAKARTEAEQAAAENAEALAAAALAKSAAEVKALEAKAQKALAQSQAALEAKNRIEEEIERHKEVLARMESAETEGLDQARLASDVAEFIGKSMSELSLFEREIQPLAIHKFEVAAQVCEQFAAALRTFAAPRLASTLSTEPREIN
ncbi:MAG: DUF3102 domain-containing protein [Alphaproteobacteria bacterium]